LRNKYSIQPLFFTDGKFDTVDYGAKDFSDYVANNSEEKVKQIINKAKKYV